MLSKIRRSFAALTLAGLLASPAFAGGEGWTNNFAGAKETAESEDKDLLLDFTGSDWCGWCIKLNNEVFSHDPFKTYAAENLVLVELDFPRDKSKLSDEVIAQNNELKEQFAIRGYPTIILADAQGKPYAKTGYKRGGPEAYIKHLEELKQKRINRDDQLKAAEQAQGIDKAKHLHEALEAVGSDLALVHYQDTVEQIINLDADNQEGLKEHYEGLMAARQLRAKLDKIMAGAQADPAKAVAQLDEILASEGLQKASKQEVLTIKSQIQMYVIRDKDAAKITLQEAIDADPESETADQLRDAMKRIFGDEG